MYDVDCLVIFHYILKGIKPIDISSLYQALHDSLFKGCGIRRVDPLRPLLMGCFWILNREFYCAQQYFEYMISIDSEAIKLF